MSGVLLKSVAKEVLGNMPATKPAALENSLLRQGVKPEELKFMQLGLDPSTAQKKADMFIGVTDDKGRLTSEYIAESETKRADKFGEVVKPAGNADYGNTVPDIAAEKMKPASYKERVVTFGRDDSAITSSHYPDQKDYLMHTRMYDQLLDGTDTRVVAEIQSDLHQQGLTDRGVEAPWQSSWMRKGLENEVLNAVKEGKQQLAIPIKPAGMSLIEYGGEPLESLSRSEGVQKWYETSVEPTARKLAKQIGADYTTHAEDGIEYAVIKLGDGSKPLNTTGLTLYAGGAPLAAYQALKAGYGEDEIRTQMLESGLTPEEVDYALSQSTKIDQAKSNDYTDEEIEAFYSSEQPTQTKEEQAQKNPDGTDYTPPPAGADAKVDKSFMELMDSKPISMQELSNALHTVYPDMSSVTTRIMAFTGDQESALRAQRTEQAAIEKIQAGFAARGVTAQFIEGEWYSATSPDNPDDLVRLTPGMWDAFWSARGETIGAVGGGIAGGRAGLAAAPPTPWSKAAGVIVGSIGGAVLGSVIGTELDYLRDAMVLSEDLSAEVSAHKALTAAEASVVGDLIGLGVFKAGASTWKAVTSVKDLLVGGNTEGAKQALRDTMFLTESEIEESVTKLARVIDTSTMSRAQQEITSTALLMPGAQDLVRVAGIIDPKASRAVVRAINDRANDVLDTTAKLAGPDVPQRLYEDLNAYVTQTKEFYSGVKMQAATAPRAAYYKFNIDKAAIEPVYEQLQANIQDPAMLEKFMLQVNKARMHTNGRTFEDLIELRQIVNDFAFNRKITNGKVSATLRGVIDNLDGNIERGSRFVFGTEKAKTWQADWTSAKLEYSKMKSLERNTLAKLVRRPGVQPELIGKALLRYSGSVDGTYEHVMNILPPKTRVNVEGSMINDLAEKFAHGDKGSPRAIHFPLLADELGRMQFTTPQARSMKAGLMEIGDVFRNDVALAQVTGLMSIPKFQSYLTADPVVRAKFAAASAAFNYVKTLVPGESGRQAALLRNTAKFLETPLNAKTLKEFADAAGPGANFSKEILELQQQQGEALARGLDKTAAQVKFYGDGTILSTRGKGAETSIPRHRIASIAQAKALAASQSVSTDNKQAFDLMLKKYGFKAVEYGSDKVRLLRN